MRVDLSDFQTKDTNSDSRFYTKLGSHDYIDNEYNPRLETESNLTMAKSVRGQYTKSFSSDDIIPMKYYVKTDPNKKLYNPIDNFSSISSRPNFINKICKSENVFTEVNESVFNKYVAFLRTLNVQWLVSAQREIK